MCPPWHSFVSVYRSSYGTHALPCIHNKHLFVGRATHHTLFHFHLSTSLHNAPNLKSNTHLTRCTCPNTPILRLPALYLDETKSPRFPPFFVCSQIQINCELEIAGRWPWMVMWISPGFSSRVASAVRRRQSGVFEVYETCRASIFW